MPHSLKVKIKGLRRKGIIADKDCNRLCKALDNEDVIDKIMDEIRQIVDEETKHDEKWARGLHYSLCIINKYRKAESEEKEEV